MYRSKHTVERQLDRLQTINSAWNAMIAGGVLAPLEDAVTELCKAQNPKRISPTMLADCLREKAKASISPYDDRYEIFRENNPSITSSAESNFYKLERNFFRALSNKADKIGYPEFDAVLDAWQKLDVKQVTLYGLDYEILKTVAIITPISITCLMVEAGYMSVDTVISKIPAASGEENDEYKIAI